jgi:hypothetical protein
MAAIVGVLLQLPVGKNISTEPRTLLATVNRQRLVRIQQTEKA